MIQRIICSSVLSNVSINEKVDIRRFVNLHLSYCFERKKRLGVHTTGVRLYTSLDFIFLTTDSECQRLTSAQTEEQVVEHPSILAVDR